MRAGISGASSSFARARTLPGSIEPRRLGAQDRVRPRHDQRRRDALVGHVADDDADPPLAEVDEVVEVAADDPRRAVVRGDLPLREVRQLARQELLLDELRDLELLLVALALGGLGRLLADELRDADGGRGLGGERREQPAVVGRVVLLRQPRAEVERPDELALGHQRHDERDAGGPQLVERGRGELEARRGRPGRARTGGRRTADRSPGCRRRRRAARPGRPRTAGDGRRTPRSGVDRREAAEGAGEGGHRGHPPGPSFGHRYEVGCVGAVDAGRARSQTVAVAGADGPVRPCRTSASLERSRGRPRRAAASANASAVRSPVVPRRGRTGGRRPAGPAGGAAGTGRTRRAWTPRRRACSPCVTGARTAWSVTTRPTNTRDQHGR